MTDYYVIYRDVEDFEPRQSFELMTPPPAGAQVIPEQTVPSFYGHKTVHIRWHRRQLGDNTLHLVTYTQVRLASDEIETLVGRAFEFAQSQTE